MSARELTFSIVVNTLDRAQSLHTLLRSLEYQSYPHFEVIIVVGPTADQTLEMLQEWEGRVRVLRCPTANLSRSRNIGLQAARGDVVAYIDDDAVPSYHWLAQLARLFQDPELAGTGGKVYGVHPETALIQHHLGISSVLAEQVDTRQSWLSELPPPGEGYQWVARMMGTNMAYRRRQLLAIGGFDEFFEWVYDDSDVALNLVNAGEIVHPVREAVVYHAPASSRNRTVGTPNGNWWIQTKAGIYFTVKHGRRGGHRWRDIVVRSLKLWHGHLLWYADLRRKRQITFAEHWKMRLQETRGALLGAYHGWRSLSGDNAPQAGVPLAGAGDSSGMLQRFQNEASSRQPTVDSISGKRPSLSLSEPPLRLALLSMAYPPDQYEGVGRLTNLMARGLFELGHTVHVIAHGEVENTTFYDGAYVHRLPLERNRYERYRHLPRLHNVLNHSHTVHEKVRQLQLNDGIQLVDSPLWQVDGLVTAVSGTAPVVVRLVTAAKQIAGVQQELNQESYLLGEVEKLLIEQATHLLPNTRATLSAVREVYNVDPNADAATIVPYGIVPVPEEQARPFPADASPQSLTILYVGRLEKRKGIADLFAAIPTVLRQVPEARFVIVGADNSRHDGFQAQHGLSYPAYFKARYPHCVDRVTFTGAVSDEVLQQHYQQCDLFVAPSLYESFGLIYLEAMNYAKPVIGCRAGGVPEVINDGNDGLLVDPASPEQLASAVTQLLQSPAKLREMGLAARQHLLDEYTHVAMAVRFASVYRQVVAATANTERV
ncbi:MAG: glycosyltransferase [Candidatus Promineifilaceae bacterium]|nr:glycosyltransferase [Candidatus Promineifilaceae bacterium]